LRPLHIVTAAIAFNIDVRAAAGTPIAPAKPLA
jgi:hypothetical protein